MWIHLQWQTCFMVLLPAPVYHPKPYQPHRPAYLQGYGYGHIDGYGVARHGYGFQKRYGAYDAPVYNEFVPGPGPALPTPAPIAPAPVPAPIAPAPAPFQPGPLGVPPALPHPHGQVPTLGHGFGYGYGHF